jgi:hypothetical protein
VRCSVVEGVGVMSGLKRGILYGVPVALGMWALILLVAWLIATAL